MSNTKELSQQVKELEQRVNDFETATKGLKMALDLFFEDKQAGREILEYLQQSLAKKGY